MLINITDIADPRLCDYTHMTDVALRRKLEPENGLFMAESKNVIERAIDTGFQIRSVMLDEKWLLTMANVLEKATGSPDGGDIPVFVTPEQLSQQITGFRLHRGALAAMERPVPRHWEDVIRDAHRIAILENLVDHTNVGAAFRSAAALGVDAILVTPSCADPFYRRSIRVSMGTVFQVPWAKYTAWPGLDYLKNAGFTVVAMALTEDAIGLDVLEKSPLVTDSRNKLAVIMGTEGTGITPATLAQSDIICKIPMGHGVDSLNVAAAAAVTMWATRRQFPQ
ncbi:MAG: RNA methyltransferase [Actinomycetaceae bacterium]|nr:RNA methyltransferase [Actinomycetaceae bacterium]